MNDYAMCNFFQKSLNPRNIDESVSDIRIRIRLPFESSFWISVPGCKQVRNQGGAHGGRSPP